MFQPAVDLATGRLLGFEALLRWVDPVHGPIMPAAFLPWADAGGHMGALTAWVLAEACLQASRWHVDHQVAVNCSAHLVRRGDALSAAAAALALSGLDPSRLTIELRQADLSAIAPAEARALTRLGVCLTMDDVDSDRSLLADLALAAVKSVKIDRSLIRRLESPGASTSRPVVGALIERCRSLGIRTVAEGVETSGQVALLRALGADVAQGYFFCRPVSAEHAVALSGAEPPTTFAFTRQGHERSASPGPTGFPGTFLDPPPAPAPPPRAGTGLWAPAPPRTGADTHSAPALPLWVSPPPGGTGLEHLATVLATTNRRLDALALAVEELARAVGALGASPPERLQVADEVPQADLCAGHGVRGSRDGP